MTIHNMHIVYDTIDGYTIDGDTIEGDTIDGYINININMIFSWTMHRAHPTSNHSLKYYILIYYQFVNDV